MKLYLIRHGESETNSKKLWTGWLNAPLTDIGRKDAEKLRPLLSRVKFDKLYSSDLDRAKETLEIALPCAEYETTELLREVNVGSLSGNPLMTDIPEGVDLSRDGYASFGGESRDEFLGRISEFIKILEKTDCEAVAAFSHGGMLMAMLEYVIGIRVPNSAILCANCAAAVFDYDGKSWKLNSWINTTRL